jgi:predicted amidophosphoribosyltransferase
MSEVCLFCSSDKDDNEFVICSECNTPEGRACGACGEWFEEVGEHANCSEEVARV